MTRALYLGVDGGATRCRARLRDADGKSLAEASGLAANIHVDFAAAIAALRAVVDEAMSQGRAQASRRPGAIAIGLGLAGFKGEADQTRGRCGFSRLSAACGRRTTR